MDERASRSSAEGAERLLGLRPPRPWPWPKWERIATACLLIAIPGACVAFFGSMFGDGAFGDGGWKTWIWAGIAVQQATLLATKTADALYAGAFGGRLREQGRKLRVAAHLAMCLAGVFMFATFGGWVAGWTGALVGGVISAVVSLGAVFSERKSYEQARATEGITRSN